VLWLVGVGCALCLAGGSLLVALHLHQADPVPPVVTAVLRVADGLVLGRVLDLGGADAEQQTVASWALASAAYLLVASAVARMLRA
jgi:hypothetical protein